MRIDTAQFPIVALHYGASANGLAEAETLLLQLTQLLQRGQPFVFLADGSPDDNTQDEQEKRAYRRKLSLWMKSQRETIRRLIKGQVYLAADTGQASVMRAFRETFIKFWGFPLFVEENPEQAKTRAQALLED